MEILFIRHTTPDVKQGICYGQSDLDVNTNFRVESDNIKNIITAYSPTHIFTSPLQRCAKLANVLFPHHTISSDARLMEMDFGLWEMQKWETIQREEFDAWANHFTVAKPPQGECFDDLITRLDDFWNTSIQHLSSDSSVAVVSHAGILRAVMMKFLDIPASKVFNLNLSYGSVILLKVSTDKNVTITILKG